MMNTDNKVFKMEVPLGALEALGTFSVSSEEEEAEVASQLDLEKLSLSLSKFKSLLTKFIMAV